MSYAGYLRIDSLKHSVCASFIVIIKILNGNIVSLKTASRQSNLCILKVKRIYDVCVCCCKCHRHSHYPVMSLAVGGCVNHTSCVTAHPPPDRVRVCESLCAPRCVYVMWRIKHLCLLWRNAYEVNAHTAR